MRRDLAAVAGFLAITAAPLTAQVVRGTVVDEARRQPVRDVALVLLDSGGVETGRTTRSDSLGGFILQTGKPGTYRVRAARIGYAQLTSGVVALAPGELVVLQLRMTLVAQQLSPVVVVERRALTLSELMSTAGFDLRQARNLGRFLDAESLAKLGLLGAGEILRTYFRPPVEFADTVRECLKGGFACGTGPDSSYVTGAPTYLYMRLFGTTVCAPEIYLDGALLSQPGDSIHRKQFAYSVIDGIGADQLYGIEVYRGSEVPASSLGGLLGATRGTQFGAPFTGGCGVIGVWTKKGPQLSGIAPRGAGRSGIQVLRGTVIDFDSGLPRPGVPVRLLAENNDLLSEEARSDSLGEFTIRTKRVGSFRLQSGDIGRGEFSTSPFIVTAEELVILKLFVSSTTPVLAPLGILARAGPETSSMTDLASFAYRRERAISGTFLGGNDIQARQPASLLDLLRDVNGVVVRGVAPTDSIMMRSTVGKRESLCAPSILINGRAGEGIGAAKALSLDRVFGIEVYVDPNEAPAVYGDVASRCGMIGVWTRDR